MRKLAFLFVILIISDLWAESHAQNKNKKKKKKKEPEPTLSGRWVPRFIRGPNGRRIPNPALAKLTTVPPTSKATLNKNGPNIRRPNGNRLDGVITPPFQRYEGEPPLQRPSWPHCINNLEIGSNWAVVSSPDYPNNISGQLQCSWIFYAARGRKIRISFDDLDLADSLGSRCGSQFVNIIDLNLQKSQGRFCGSKIPGDYVSQGNTLRLDLQADTSLEAHRGFQAGIRSEPATIQSGTRQKSLLYHGTTPPKTTITTTTRRRIRKTTVRPTTTTIIISRVPSPINILQNNYFGKYNQPNNNQALHVNDDNNNLVAVYVLVGIVCLVILFAGFGFAYRRKIKAYINKWRSQETLESNKKTQNQEVNYHTNDDFYEYSNEDSMSMRSYQERKFSLPGSHTSSIRESLRIGNGGRRKSIIFEDKYFAALAESEKQQQYNLQHLPNYNINHLQNNHNLQQPPRYNFYPQNNLYNQYNHSYPSYPPSNAESFAVPPGNHDYGRQHHNTEFRTHREPLYEDDNISVTSACSVRSTNRHPDHAMIKQKEIAKRRNSIQRSKSLTNLNQREEPTYCTDAEVASFLGPKCGNGLRPAKSMTNLNQSMHNFQNPENVMHRRRSFCM